MLALYAGQNNIPILPIERVSEEQTCCVQPLDDISNVTDKAQSAIYRTLINFTPPSNKTMKKFLANYSHTQDGYKALFDLCYLALPFLNNNKNGWGPDWLDHENPHQYLSKLVEKTRDEARRGNQYTGIEQS